MKLAVPGLFAVALATCLVSGATAAPQGWKTYTDPRLGWSVSYPPDWRVDADYSIGAPYADTTIRGVSFTAPAGYSQNTNLGSAVFSVETRPGKNCKPTQFSDFSDQILKVKADGRRYLSLQGEDGGAGQRDNVTIHVIEGTCLAVRYALHYSVFENFEPGSITRFDQKGLSRMFNAMRASLKVRK